MLVFQELRCVTTRDSVTVILTAPSLACVASVSIWFRSKERPVLASREMMCSFTCAIFRAVFDSRSSFFAPRPHGNAYYAGYSVS